MPLGRATKILEADKFLSSSLGLNRQRPVRTDGSYPDLTFAVDEHQGIEPTSGRSDIHKGKPTRSQSLLIDEVAFPGAAGESVPAEVGPLVGDGWVRGSAHVKDAAADIERGDRCARSDANIATTLQEKTEIGLAGFAKVEAGSVRSSVRSGALGVVVHVPLSKPLVVFKAEQFPPCALAANSQRIARRACPDSHVLLAGSGIGQGGLDEDAIVDVAVEADFTQV